MGTTEQNQKVTRATSDGGKMLRSLENFIWVPVGKTTFSTKGRWKYIEPLEKAEAKSINLVGTSKG